MIDDRFTHYQRMHIALCNAFRYSDLLTQSKADHADITDDEPPSLPITLFDNECTPGYDR